MSEFIKRLTAPSKSNKYYYNNSFNTFAGTKYAPPKIKGNCTWYAFGRFAEMLGVKPKLNTGNACYWYKNNGGYPHNDNYKRGQTPKVRCDSLL
jgi:surface antigen